MTDSLDRLYQAVLAARGADPATSRTARLLRAGRGKMGKKLAEEAVEVVIDAMTPQGRGARSRPRPQAALIARQRALAPCGARMDNRAPRR